MIREILTDPNPLLRQISREVTPEELATPETQQLIDDMIATLKSANGAGLAAPQVGVNLRIVVVDKPMTVLVNPVLDPMPDGRESCYEGCLSVPGIRGEVLRHRTVRIRALARDGRPIQTQWTQFRANVVQHEVDHLDGILYTDRAILTFSDGKTPANLATNVGLSVRTNGGAKKTLVIDSEKPVGGTQFFAFNLEQPGRLVDLRIQPGGAVVTGVWLAGMRLKARGFKAGQATERVLGPSGLQVSRGDQLRFELRIEKGKKRIVAEADFDG